MPYVGLDADALALLEIRVLFPAGCNTRSSIKRQSASVSDRSVALSGQAAQSGAPLSALLCGVLEAGAATGPL